MSRFPEDLLLSVRRAVDLADLVGRYVPLKRSGKSYKACCPFHTEKTPSFHVWPEEGTWKCFGCGKGGNGFIFLMEREGLTFPEAVRQLAREAGIALEQDDDPGAAEQASRLERLREVTEWACRFFEKSLRTKEGEVARDYLRNRGITGETAVRFRLGYAPPGWQNLVDAARRTGIAEADLVDLGLTRRKEAHDGRAERVFDMFRDRVTFPIADTQGRVVAFGARVLGDEEPKYLNSPESPLFSKGRTVYALHLAKQEMLRCGEGAVMEGYTDVILAHQCGWRVAVAGLGTALTREQASTVARYVKRLYLVYDGDAAGRKAAERNAPAFLPEEIETRVALLPPEEDPCDLLLRAGLPALRACLDQSSEAFEHLVAAKSARHDLRSVPGRAEALDEVLAPLVPVTSEVRRALYLRRAAEELHVPEDVVLDRFRELRAREARAHRYASTSPAGAQQVSEGASPTRAPPAAPRPAAPMPALEELLAEAMIGCPELRAEAAARLPAEAVSHPVCRELVDLLLSRPAGTASPPCAEDVVATIEDPAVAGFAAGLLGRSAGKDLLRQGRDCIDRLSAQFEAQRLRSSLDSLADPAAQRRAMSPEDGEVLRRWVELNRRRAARS